MKITQLFLLVGFVLILTSCEDDIEIFSRSEVNNNEVNDFIWQSMNSWYLWQEEVELLDDTKDDNATEYAHFLNSYASPEALFEALRYQPEIVDRYSFITDDYEELQNSLQGITTSFGYDFRLVGIQSSNYVFGYVRYVVPNSPAAAAGIQRGDLFVSIDGEILTRDNYRELLSKDSYTIGFAEITNNSIAQNGETTTITSIVLNENPVHHSDVFTLSDGKKVGYLVYNGFIPQYNQQLNDVFKQFKNEGVTDLVLDLRYNGGGSVSSAVYLSSMIYSTNTNLLIASIEYNHKNAQYNRHYGFSDKIRLFDGQLNEIGTEPIESLNLSKLYVLVSGSTASSSEVVVNTLKPYINVVLIGTQTVGKNVGSITLYDSPQSNFLDDENANSAHKYAIQPIVSRLVNSQGTADYLDGFVPDIEIDETDFLADFKPLGDPTEPLLHAALNDICSTCVVTDSPIGYLPFNVESVFERKEFEPNYQQANLNELISQ